MANVQNITVPKRYSARVLGRCCFLSDVFRKNALEDTPLAKRERQFCFCLAF
jgi:hypothetical protein